MPAARRPSDFIARATRQSFLEKVVRQMVCRYRVDQLTEEAEVILVVIQLVEADISLYSDAWTRVPKIGITA